MLLVMSPSWARLGSARIQLELEASQLGSARKNFESARGAKKFNYRAGFDAFFILISFKLNILNFIKVNLNLMYIKFKKSCNNLHKTMKINGILKKYVDFVNNSSSDSARFLEIASSARLSSETCQLGSARKIPARMHHY